MRYITLFALLCLLLPLYSQTGNAKKKSRIEGTVLEKSSKESVNHAVVKLLNPSDSTLAANIATNEKGYFSLHVPKAKYIVKISYIGFNDFYKDIEITSGQEILNLGKIELLESSILLNETTIEAKIPDIVVKGDTIEFNAGAYTNSENDLLHDIIKNIAGVEIDKDGNIMANGKPVQKILVDGKEFFGNDMLLALNNLPANMIKKIQLYKKDSETAKITGFKDKDPQQVMNLVVKEELKKSTFGNILGGYGSDERYITKFNVNHMRGENQTSTFGNMNNVNNDGSDFSHLTTGIETNKSGGINTNITRSEKFKLGVNMRVYDNQNLEETHDNSQLFIASGDRFTKEESVDNNKRTNWGGGINFHWTPDTLTNIFFNSGLGATKSHSEYTRKSQSYYTNKSDTIKSSSNNNSDGEGYAIHSILNIGRRLGNKGRAISLSINHSMRNDDTDGNNYSQTRYIGATKDSIVDQRLKTVSKTNSFHISTNYVEPLAKDLLLQLSYSINNNASKRMRDTWKKDINGEYTLLDTAYTRDTENKYINQNINASIQLSKTKYRLSGGFGIDPTHSSSKVIYIDSIQEIKQDVVNFSPNLNFYYMPNQNASFSVNYSGSSMQPSISQISAEKTITATAEHIGNPNLKPSFENSLNFSFQKSDFESNRYLMLSGGIHNTLNDIVDDVVIVDSLNSHNTFENVNGKMGANIGFTYDSPLKNKKFTISSSTNGNYYRNVGLMNKQKTVTDNISISENLSLRFKSKHFESKLQSSITHTIAKNNLTSRKDETATNYGLSNSTYVRLPYDFTIQSDISYKYYAGYGADFKKSETLWNASLSKQFLKKKAGTLKIQLYDILDDRNTLIRNISGTGISDSKSNSIHRYFMLSFSYRFNFIKSGKADSDSMMESEF